MKNLVCVKAGEGLDGIGETLGHRIQAVIYKNDDGQPDLDGDIELRTDGIALYILCKLGGGLYGGYGTDSLYKFCNFRKKLINAFEGYGYHHGMTKRDARKWGRCMADGYFDKGGKPISELVDALVLDYDCDFSQSSFDSLVAEKISYW